MLIKTGILLSIFLFIILFFIQPTYTYGKNDGNDGNDGNGGNNYEQSKSTLMDIELGVEIEPNTLDANGEVHQASRILYLISIFNGSEVTIFDALLVAKVPQHTAFDFESSDVRWSSTVLIAAGKTATERTCPDRHPPGLECSLELSNILPGERVSTVRFAVDVNGDIPLNVETIDFNAELLGSMKDNGPLDIREAASINTDIANPTALPTEEAPEHKYEAQLHDTKYYVYIPWVAR